MNKKKFEAWIGVMTANSRKVFDYLKGNGVGVKFTHKEVADASQHK